MGSHAARFYINESDLRVTEGGSGFSSLEWLTPEIHAALDAIAPPHAVKKQTTVLLVAQALATGKSLRSVFDRDDTCKADHWYGTLRKGKRKLGWKDIPEIATALHLATERARWWVRVRQGQSVQNALDILLNAGEVAAQQLANMVRMGVLVFDFGADGLELRRAEVGHILEASKQILDRISTTTAPKSTTATEVTVDQWRAEQAKRKKMANQTLADFADDNEG